MRPSSGLGSAATPPRVRVASVRDFWDLPMTTLEGGSCARLVRDQGLPFADSLSETSILDALNQQGSRLSRQSVRSRHDHLGLSQPGPQ